MPVNMANRVAAWRGCLDCARNTPPASKAAVPMAMAGWSSRLWMPCAMPSANSGVILPNMATIQHPCSHWFPQPSLANPNIPGSPSSSTDPPVAEMVVTERRKKAQDNTAPPPPELEEDLGVGEGCTPVSWRYSDVPLVVQMLLECLCACAVFLSLPVASLYFFGRERWYRLDELVPEGADLKWDVEVTRWCLLLTVLFVGRTVSSKTAAMATRTISFIVRRNRQALRPESRRFLELVLATWKYVGYVVTAIGVWLTAATVFPFRQTDIRDTTPLAFYPWQYHVERLALVAVFACAWLVVEKACLHSIAVYFSRSVYQERASKCAYKIWVVKTLRNGYAKGRTHRGRSLQGRAEYPAEAVEVSTFLLEHSGTGRRPREGFADLLFSHYTQGQPTLRTADLAGIFAPNELKRAMSVFDQTTAEAGEATRAEFAQAIDDVYEERWSIVHGVHGHTAMVARLDGMMKWIVGCFTVLCAITVYKVDMKKFGQFLAFLMIPFGDTLKSAFSAVIFIITTHPYDVGDRVVIDGTHYFAQSVGLMATEFRRMDGAIMYAPNYVLAGQSVANIRRTPRQATRYELHFDSRTTSAQIGQLRSRIQEYIGRPGQRDFAAIHAWFLQLHDATRISMVLLMRHNTNQQEGHPWAMRNTGFLEYLKEVTKDLGIDYKPPVRTIVSLDETHPALFC